MNDQLAFALAATAVALIVVPIFWAAIFSLMGKAVFGFSWKVFFTTYGVALGIVAAGAAMLWGIGGLFFAIFSTLAG